MKLETRRNINILFALFEFRGYGFVEFRDVECATVENHARVSFFHVALFRSVCYGIEKDRGLDVRARLDRR